MLTIDGSLGEGGGQILRTALALSLCTGQPFCIENIRAARKKPGLLRQHLAAVNAATLIGKADISGAEIGSSTLSFIPKIIQPGEYHFSIGTAGSTTLVLQTVLYALLTASAPSVLILEGGTHNPFAPPFDFLQKALLPILMRMGAMLDVRLERYGFYPAGGGRFSISITPVRKLNSVSLIERGELLDISAEAVIAGLPEHIAERELALVQEKMNLKDEQLRMNNRPHACGPGNILLLTIRHAHVTEIFTGFGEFGRSAESITRATVQQARSYLASGMAVSEYLADQLLLPMALAGGGEFSTVRPSQHTLTHIQVIEQFLQINITIRETGKNRWRIILG